MKLKQNKQSKLVVALSAVILLLVALSATLTFAYFTDKTAETSDSIEFGVLKFNDDSSFTLAKSVSDECGESLFVPGCTVTLKGSAKLTNTIDAYVRMKVEVAITKDDVTTNIPESVNANAIISELFADTELETYFASNETKWLSPTTVDGYKYYNAKVAKDAGLTLYDFGEGKEITFNVSEYNNDWQGVEITIKLTAETIQAQHVGVDLTDKTGKDVADAIAGATAAWAAVAGNTEA